MKKKYMLILCVIVLAMIITYLITSLVGFVSKASAQDDRFVSIEESIDKGISKKFEVIDTIEKDDVALVILKDREGDFSDKVLFKDSEGWSSMKLDYSEKEYITKEGFVYLIEHNGMTVIKIVKYADSTSGPVITDTLDSEVSTVYAESGAGWFVSYSVICIEGELSNDYVLSIGNETLSFVD